MKKRFKKNFFENFKENIREQIKRAFGLTQNIVIAVPKGMKYKKIPDIIKKCVGSKDFFKKRFSVEIEEVYNNEILEAVFLYFGDTA